MKKGLVLVIAGILGSLCFSGCMMIAPVVPPTGAVFNDTKAPLNVEVNNTKMGAKRGESSTVSILGLVAFGDGSIAAAAKDGRITTVQHADYEYLNVIGVFQKYTTIVYGE